MTALCCLRSFPFRPASLSNFLISGSGLISSGFHSVPLSLRPVRVLLSSFPVAENKSILVGFSFGLSSAHVGYPLASDLLLRAGSGNIDQSKDLIAMMHD